MHHSISKIEEYRLNKKILTLSLLLVLTTMCITGISVSTVKAQTGGSIGTGQWITQYTITDGTTGVTLLSKDFATGKTSGTLDITESEDVVVTATINVGVSNPSTDLTLGTGMQHSSSEPNTYWSLVTTTYSLGNFNPNSQSISFPEVAGTFTITCYGVTPTGVVEKAAPNGITLNVPTPCDMLLLKDPTGNVLDEITPNVINAAIYDYQGILSNQESTLKNLKSSGVASGYVDIYADVINESQALEAQGFTAGATALLNDLSSTGAPPSSASQAFFIPVAVVLAIVAALFAFMFMRIRGKVSYMNLVVEDQIKDLEGLTLRASKIDRTMSSNLESVKDRLKRLVGM